MSGTHKDHIHLHLEHLGPEVIHARLPGIAETARIFAGVDVNKEPIPVLPTVHYNMGGIPCNVHGEVVTSKNGNPDSVVPGLMAVGEAACVSVHGANRLGSNSLLDLVVFGREASRHAATVVKPGQKQAPLPNDAGDYAVARLDRLRNAKGSRSTAEIRLEMQKTMQRDAAVFRTGDIPEGRRRCAGQDLRSRSTTCAWPTAGSSGTPIWSKPSNSTICWARPPPRLSVPKTARRVRGAHAREDFKERDDTNWQKHTLCWVEEGGKTRIEYRPVHMNTLTKDVEPIPPKARTY